MFFNASPMVYHSSNQKSPFQQQQETRVLDPYSQEKAFLSSRPRIRVQEALENQVIPWKKNQRDLLHQFKKKKTAGKPSESNQDKNRGRINAVI